MQRMKRHIFLVYCLMHDPCKFLMFNVIFHQDIVVIFVEYFSETAKRVSSVTSQYQHQ